MNWKIIAVSVGILFSQNSFAEFPRFENLRKISEDSLTQNIIAVGSKNYLRAGAHQFQSLWTRDFCFASRGLFAMKRADVVRDQLTLILDQLRVDGLTGKYFDNVSIFARYISIYFKIRVPMREPLKAVYDAGVPKSSSMDDNSLVILTALNYLENTQDRTWFVEHEEQLKKAFHFYDSKKQDGLLVQGKFQDWQDTVERQGKAFYTNLLYFKAMERLAQFSEFAISNDDVSNFREKLISTFLDKKSGVFLSLAGEPYVSLDGNLLAIDLELFPKGSDEARSLYYHLSNHVLFTQNGGVPGACSTPDYPKNWVGFEPKLIGIQHYHDHLYWSWLMALSGKVAYQMGDTERASAIFGALEKIAMRDGSIGEVYRNEGSFSAWRSTFYKSESPFSWGSGVTLGCIDSVGH